jgi:hypothetical protein
VEVGQSVTVVADVQDAETPLTALTYEWTASAGTVSGTGRSVTWSLASGAASTPADVMLTLTVLEPYQVLQGSQIVTQQHRVTATSGALRVHDSVAEIGAMVLRFLVDLFGDSSVGPDDAVVDFNRNLCPAGWQAEYNDIVDNRDTVTILSAEATIQSVAVTGAFASADVVAPCTFRDFVKPSGPQRTAAGTCTLTTVYEQNRWWLCTSNWDGTVVNSVSGTPLGHDPRVSGYR